MVRPQLIDMMPYWLQVSDASGDYTNWMAVLQSALDNAYSILDRYQRINDVDKVDLETVVDAMLDSLGNPFIVSNLSLTQKRLLVRGLITLFKKFGTDDSVREVIAIFTNKVVTNIIRGHVTGWELGVHVLGDGIHPLTFEEPLDFIIMNPSRLFLIYSFMVELDSAPTSAEEDQIHDLMEVVKPAYMHYLGVHGYEPTPTILHWEIGVSELDLTTDLH